MGSRGSLNPIVQEVAERCLGRPLKCTAELRLLPYLDYLMKNSQQVDPRKINQEERELLAGLRKEGHIEGGASGLAVTKEFYDAMQQILWQAYVVQGAADHAVEDAIVTVTRS